MPTKKRINSCAKGKAGEREAANYLKSLGFTDAKRTQQHKGTGDSSDVECPESLSRVFIEVKYAYDRSAIDVGTKGLNDAMELANEQAKQARKEPCILWRPKGCTFWRMTFIDMATIVTIAGDEDIRWRLKALNGR